MMNQAIFSKLLVESDGRITAKFTKPFKSIVTPITDVLGHYKQEKVRGTEVTTDFLSVIANRISHFFGHGLNNEFLVDDMGIEPTTSAMRKDSENFFGLFLLLLAVSTGVHFICKPL